MQQGVVVIKFLELAQALAIPRDGSIFSQVESNKNCSHLKFD
jgi:hypothetical protein